MTTRPICEGDGSGSESEEDLIDLEDGDGIVSRDEVGDVGIEERKQFFGPVCNRYEGADATELTVRTRLELTVNTRFVSR